MNEKEYKARLAETPGYRYANRVGDRLYVAGQVPNDSLGKIVGIGDSYTQTEQCFKNLITVLGCHGFEIGDVQRLTIYVIGERQYLTDAWRAVQDRFSNGVPPATLLGVALLGYDDQLVEIDAEVIKAVD